MTKYVRLMMAFRLLVGAVLCVALLGGAGYIAFYLMTHRPKPMRRPPAELAPLVVVEDIVAGEEQVVLRVNGNAIPAVDVDLQARVSGEVIAKHPQLIEGGLVRKGELLLEIDPSDYELALITSQTKRTQAEAELAIERGQQDVALREWEMLDMADSASEADRGLALREPYLRQKEAALASAKAGVAQAELNLARTKIVAPLNAIVREVSVDVGDQATTQTALAQLIGTDVYWAEVSVPVDELKWIDLPLEGDTLGSPARVVADDGHVRQGHVLKLLGDIEPEANMARLLIEVKDPMDTEASGAPHPLLLGQFVTVEILGRTVDDVFRIPRDAVRDGRSVWLASEDSRLRITPVDLVWSNIEWALVRGLDNPSRLVVSDLATPVADMAIQIEGEEKAEDASPGDTTGSAAVVEVKP